jgi:hypothetical protein|tara:strand:- start:2416 stop:2544 length:129 start_codon:yes stop_codon:yes gene_type:complete
MPKRKEDTIHDILDRIEEDLIAVRDKVDELESGDDYEDSDEE